MSLTGPMSSGKGDLSKNLLFKALSGIGVIDPDSVTPFFPRVRDRADISVFRCSKNGVIFLSRSDHMVMEHYVEKADDSQLVSGTTIISPTALEDDSRRSQQIRHLVKNRRWMDVGTGAAGILDLLSSEAARYAGVEPNERFRKTAKGRGHSVYKTMDDVPDEQFDLITLFHVFEHLVQPLEVLKSIKSRLSPSGMVWMEVPHARDFLLTTLASREFMSFSFWSEHLILHTRESLAAILSHVGFTDIEVTGYQRYPLSNHLFWLAKGEPGGHVRWSFLNDEALVNAYAATIERIDQTDTLIVTATVGDSCG